MRRRIPSSNPPVGTSDVSLGAGGPVDTGWMGWVDIDQDEVPGCVHLILFSFQCASNFNVLFQLVTRRQSFSMEKLLTPSHIPLSYLTPLHFIILEFAFNPGPWNISWPTSLYAGSYRRFFIWPSRATIYLSLDSLQCLFLFVPPLLRFLPMVTRGFPTHQANFTFTKTRHINRHFQLPFCIIYINEVMRVSVPAVE